jgi:hypothetical protein
MRKFNNAMPWLQKPVDFRGHPVNFCVRDIFEEIKSKGARPTFRKEQIAKISKLACSNVFDGDGKRRQQICRQNRSPPKKMLSSHPSEPTPPTVY